MSVAMTPEQLAESRRYGRLKLRCALIDIVVDLVFLLIIALGCAIALDSWLLDDLGVANSWLRLLAAIAITLLGCM